MMASDIPFYPTGSRAFNQENFESDWNFFAEYDTTGEDFLLSAGAREITVAKITEEAKIIVKMFQIEQSGITVVIFLVTDACTMLAIQNKLILMYPNGLPGTHDTRNEIWRTATEIMIMAGMLPVRPERVNKPPKPDKQI